MSEENRKHVASALRALANDIRTQRFTRQMLGALAAKMEGLAVLLEQPSERGANTAEAKGTP